MATTEGELARAGIVIDDTTVTFTRALEVSEDLIVQGSLSVGNDVAITGDLKVLGVITGTVQSKYCLQMKIEDVSSAVSLGSCVVPSFGGGSITKIWTVLQGDIGASGGSIATHINGADISAANEHDVVIANSAVAGDVDSATVASGTHTVAAGDCIMVHPSDTGTNAVALQVVVEITQA